MFTNPRIEIFLDKNSIQHALPYVNEYYLKVKETKPPAFVQKFRGIEFHIRKFANKDAREQFFDMMKEAQNVKVWMKPLQTQAKKEQQEQDSHNLMKGGAGGVGIKQIR